MASRSSCHYQPNDVVPTLIELNDAKSIDACLYSVSDHDALSTSSSSPTPRNAIAVVSHPYGPLGGSQSDHVVVLIAKTLQLQGITTATFNFTGPTSWTGAKEQQEYLSVVRHLLAQTHNHDVKVVYCCGYSYGSMCLPTALDVNLQLRKQVEVRYIVVSPLLAPVSFFLSLSREDRYVRVREQRHLAIWGERDQFTSASRLRKVWSQGKQTHADHFWRDEDDREILRTSIVDFLDQVADST